MRGGRSRGERNFEHVATRRLDWAVEIDAEPAHAAAMKCRKRLGRCHLWIDDRDTATVSRKLVKRIERGGIVDTIEARLHDDEARDTSRRAQLVQRRDACNTC